MEGIRGKKTRLTLSSELLGAIHIIEIETEEILFAPIAPKEESHGQEKEKEEVEVAVVLETNAVIGTSVRKRREVENTSRDLDQFRKKQNASQSLMKISILGSAMFTRSILFMMFMLMLVQCIAAQAEVEAPTTTEGIGT